MCVVRILPFVWYAHGLTNVRASRRHPMLRKVLQPRSAFCVSSISVAAMMFRQKFMSMIRPGARLCFLPTSANLVWQAPPLSQQVRAAITFHVTDPFLLKSVHPPSMFHFKDFKDKAMLFGTSLALLQLCGASVVLCGGDEDDTKKSGKRGAGYIETWRSGPGSEWIDLDAMIQDPSNRDKDGVKIPEVLAKAEGIEQQGFNFDKIRVILIQLPLDPDERSDIFSKDQEWKDLDAAYPACDPKKVEYTVVGGNHLVTFLKMVRANTNVNSFISIKQADGVSSRTTLQLL